MVDEWTRGEDGLLRPKDSPDDDLPPDARPPGWVRCRLTVSPKSGEEGWQTMVDLPARPVAGDGIRFMDELGVEVLCRVDLVLFWLDTEEHCESLIINATETWKDSPSEE